MTDRSKARERVLTDEEIRALWQTLPSLRSIACQQAIKFMLVTGQRIGEVVGMRKDELDLKHGAWNIPGSRTKNGFPHSVPLSRLALEIIRDNGGEFRIARLTVSDTIRDQLQFDWPRWTAHDLRRSALTGMAKLGVAPIVIGHVANHRTTTNTKSH
jgi:integrase